MFAFRLWSRFGAFRDPITITQNVTLSIPPKTTVGGMLAAIIGLDYNEYFENPMYFDFGYSLVLLNPIRKISFSQNYIEDYTKKSATKHKALKNYLTSPEDCLSKYLILKMTKPKPIRRELLINPGYIIFIKDFIYENDIIKRLQSHDTCFSLYMGNSEFPANYKYIKCNEIIERQLIHIDSFTKLHDNIKFETNRKYTTIYSATKTTKGRKYRDYRKITICDNTISFYRPIAGICVKTSEGEYNCEFI